jgi:hypothetical protein
VAVPADAATDAAEDHTPDTAPRDARDGGDGPGA